MTTLHARLSPSSAHRWMKCAASIALETQFEDTSSPYADEGTAAHEVAATALTQNTDAKEYLGNTIPVNGNSIEVTEEMVGNVQVYLDFIRAIGGQLSIEERLDISSVTGEQEAYGTSDAVIAVPKELIIADLKYGRGVKVYAKDNEQLRIYALAALELYSLTEEFEQVRLVIIQPRLDHIDEWVCSVADLRLFEAQVKQSATRCNAALTYFQKYDAVHDKYFEPGEKQCMFCKAKANCPALANQVLATVADDFVDISKPIAPQIEDVAQRLMDNTTLGNALQAVDLVEGWCKAIRAKAESELISGRAVAGYKLVAGRKGNRAWKDANEAETMLKQMRLKTEQMYDMKLISPTTAEKLNKSGAIGPRQWPKLQDLITQADGKPTVVPESDERPPYQLAASTDEFENEEEPLA